MRTLYLLPAEQVLFERLSGKLREGWEVTQDTVRPEHADELEIRRKMASFHDPSLQELSERLRTLKGGEFDAALRTFNPQALSGEQLAELCFVLGVDVLSAFLSYLFTQVQTDEDIEGIAGFTEIRHALSQVNFSSGR